jgi:hypothetical protein
MTSFCICISSDKNLYNPENFFIHSDGGGAGNNWAAGYEMADSAAEEVLEKSKFGEALALSNRDILFL